MKTKEERNAFKHEAEVLNQKLSELNEEELNKVTGGQRIITPLRCQRAGDCTCNPVSCEAAQNPDIYCPRLKELK